MGNAYTTAEKVIDEILDDIDPAVQALIPGWIEDASRKIDAALPNYETPFAAIAGSPPTPSIIEEAARFLVVDRVLRKLGLLRTDENGRLVDTFKKDAEATLEKLRHGELIIPADQLSAAQKPATVPVGSVSQAPAKIFTEASFSKW